MGEISNYFLQVVRGVHAYGFVTDRGDFDAVTIFQGPKLFKFLKLFQRGGLHFREMEEEFSTKYIDADVFEHPFRQRSVRSKGTGFQSSDMEIPGEGDGRSGEIKSKILLVHHDFHDMGIEPILWVFYPRHQS